MTDKNILIVEDEWIIYDELASFLTKKHFNVAPYTKSYEEAINQIKLQIPDIVLLDINLQGEKDGIDVGKVISKNFNIPFIYLSAYSDDANINRAQRTSPDTFLIKTKPDINKDQLYVSIKMALSKAISKPDSEKEGIFVYTDYYRDVKQVSSNELKKVLVRFNDILWIETDMEKRNYLLFHTKNTKTYFKNSLSKVKEILPFHFVRINANQVVNLKKVEGKINHSSFKIQDKNFRIGLNFTKEVHKVLHSLYHE
ncbi:MAG: hypothetical protein B6D61_02370 [Bacteroidetes bacterium 4484_249]|nr:MAG: hypothetical protein B6D61_02370 [Bacteroidetes bacterium 4484_249]